MSLRNGAGSSGSVGAERLHRPPAGCVSGSVSHLPLMFTLMAGASVDPCINDNDDHGSAARSVVSDGAAGAERLRRPAGGRTPAGVSQPLSMFMRMADAGACGDVCGSDVGAAVGSVASGGGSVGVGRVCEPVDGGVSVSVSHPFTTVAAMSISEANANPVISGRRDGGRFHVSGAVGGVAVSERIVQGAPGVLSAAWLGVDVPALDADGLRLRLVEIGRAESQLAVAKADALNALAAREGEAAAGHTAAQALSVSGRAARSHVRTAAALSELAATREGLLTGSVPAGHAQLIARAAGDAPVDEQFLVERAERQSHDEFRRTVACHVAERSGDDGASLLGTAASAAFGAGVHQPRHGHDRAERPVRPDQRGAHRRSS